jgi:glycosyltransferase involved in cell wall biosynthesis
MPSYNNFTEVWFTVQALRLYHDLADCEILVVDNFGSERLQKFIKNDGGKTVRYEKRTEIQGVSYAKNCVFEHAKGDYVLCIDSHILVRAGALDVKLDNDDFYQGPLFYGSQKRYSLEWLPEWRKNMWGVWAPHVTELPQEPKEIWAMGAGFFACRRESWLGFNPGFRGFGGETGYIQEKYRKAGRKVLCHPKLVWMHHFHDPGTPMAYPMDKNDRIKNYIIGFEELGLDTKPIYDHFATTREKIFSQPEKIGVPA